MAAKKARRVFSAMRNRVANRLLKRDSVISFLTGLRTENIADARHFGGRQPGATLR
jgi:hypothetical protein